MHDTLSVDFSYILYISAKNDTFLVQIHTKPFKTSHPLALINSIAIR